MNGRGQSQSVKASQIEKPFIPGGLAEGGTEPEWPINDCRGVEELGGWIGVWSDREGSHSSKSGCNPAFAKATTDRSSAPSGLSRAYSPPNYGGPCPSPMGWA